MGEGSSPDLPTKFIKVEEKNVWPCFADQVQTLNVEKCTPQHTKKDNLHHLIPTISTVCRTDEEIYLMQQRHRVRVD